MVCGVLFKLARSLFVWCVVCCLSVVVDSCLSVDVWCLLFAVLFLLFVVWCLLAVCCVLLVVCWLFVVVRCFSPVDC